MARNTSHPDRRADHLIEDTARTPATSSRRSKTVIAAVLAIAILLVATTASGAATKVYAIVYGDTLNDIAANHGTDVATLVGLNGIENPDVIIAGDDLDVPDGDLTTYTVREGDTLADIAAMHGVDIHELAAVNKLSDPDLIHTGQALLVYLADESAPEAAPAESEDSEETATDDSAPATVDSEDPAEEESTSSDNDVVESDETQSGRLHLVQVGESLADIAAAYEVTQEQLIAANALQTSEVAGGMILKIPLSKSAGVELIGMPSAQEQWPLMSELAAASIATAYWGAPVSAEEILSLLDRSDNPHVGFRGDPHGMFGTTVDYGVYSGPLADALASLGFTVEAFYSDGDSSALTSRIDAGKPVVVWVTHDLRLQDRTVVDDEFGRYSLIPEQHAVLVYGYDESGLMVMDVGKGTSSVWNWDEFLASWSLFDGMGLSIALE